jgi:hypothetical protein
VTKDQEPQDANIPLIAPSALNVGLGAACPECGSNDTAWNCTQTTNSGVADGRLRMHDVTTVFFLGCNCCSETIRTMSGDEVARMMTEPLTMRSAAA